MHCYGMSQSITDRFAAVVDVFFFSIHERFSIHVFIFFLKIQEVSLWLVVEEDDGTG